MKKTLSAMTLVLALAAGSAYAADAPSEPKGGEHHRMGGHMFKETDTNSDGLISKDEWTAKGDKMFSDIDANKDGKLSQDEMKAHHDAKRAEWEKRKAEHAEKAGDVKKGEKPAAPEKK